MMKHIYLVESGKYNDGCKDFTRAFEDESEAWRVVLRRYKKYNLDRNNNLKKEGFLGVLHCKNRWILITRIILMEKRKKQKI